MYINKLELKNWIFFFLSHDFVSFSFFSFFKQTHKENKETLINQLDLNIVYPTLTYSMYMMTPTAQQSTGLP